MRYARRKIWLPMEKKLTKDTREPRGDEDRYGNLFLNLPDGVLVRDAEGVILEANESIARRLEVPREALVGRNVAEFLVPDGAAASTCPATRPTSSPGRESSATVPIFRRSRSAFASSDSNCGRCWTVPPETAEADLGRFVQDVPGPSYQFDDIHEAFPLAQTPPVGVACCPSFGIRATIPALGAERLSTALRRVRRLPLRPHGLHVARPPGEAAGLRRVTCGHGSSRRHYRPRIVAPRRHV